MRLRSASITKSLVSILTCLTYGSCIKQKPTAPQFTILEGEQIDVRDEASGAKESASTTNTKALDSKQSPKSLDGNLEETVPTRQETGDVKILNLDEKTSIKIFSDKLVVSNAGSEAHSQENNLKLGNQDSSNAELAKTTITITELPLANKTSGEENSLNKSSGDQSPVNTDSAKTPTAVSKDYLVDNGISESDQQAKAPLDGQESQTVLLKDISSLIIEPNTAYEVELANSAPAENANSQAAAESTTAVEALTASIVTPANIPEIKASALGDSGAPMHLEIKPAGNPAYTEYLISLVIPSTGEVVGYIDAATGKLLGADSPLWARLPIASPDAGTVVFDIVGLNKAEFLSIVVKVKDLDGAIHSSEEHAIGVNGESNDDVLVASTTEGDASPASPVASGDPEPATVSEPMPGSEASSGNTATDGLASSKAELRSQRDILKDIRENLKKLRRELKEANVSSRKLSLALRKAEKTGAPVPASLQEQYAASLSQVATLKNAIDTLKAARRQAREGVKSASEMLSKKLKKTNHHKQQGKKGKKDTQEPGQTDHKDQYSKPAI